MQLKKDFLQTLSFSGAPKLAARTSKYKRQNKTYTTQPEWCSFKSLHLCDVWRNFITNLL